MRKKMKMRAGGKVKKYAEGGRVEADPPAPVRRRRPNEATAGDIGDAALGATGIMDRVLSYPLSLVNPVTGTALERAAGRRVQNAVESINRRTQDIDDAARGVRRGARVDMPPRPPEDVDGTGTGAAARPVRTPAARPPRRGQTRSREMSADELNDISLGLARGTRMGPLAPGAERNIAGRMGAGYKKGGRVAVKKGKK